MAIRNVLWVQNGQSQGQGAAMQWQGPRIAANLDRARSMRTKETDPYPGSNNTGQGGSCFPFLQDMLWARGIRLTVWNGAIGGASIYQYTGRVGATITSPTVPATVGFFSGGEMSGGTSVCVDGNPGWDPFGLHARSRALIQSYAGRFDYVLSYWQHGESDQNGVSRTQMAQAYLANADYMLASGVDAHMIGLSLKLDATSDADMQLMQLAVSDAVAARSKVYKGEDLYAFWGSNAPRYKDSAVDGFVHLTLRGQFQRARLIMRALEPLRLW